VLSPTFAIVAFLRPQWRKLAWLLVMAMTGATCILPIEVIVLDFRINASLRYVVIKSATLSK
jgi:hypothetical protein